MYERCPRNPAMQVRRVSEIMIATRKGRQNRSTSGRAFPRVVPGHIQFIFTAPGL